MGLDREVATHYSGQEVDGRRDLVDVLFDALARSGKEPARLSPEDLAPIDEFHVRGREATAELGQGLQLAPGMQVLDVGSGLGGPSRHLAERYECTITGIDLTDDYCRAARLLAEQVGLGARVSYRCGNALAMPFEDGSFDAAYSQHVAMNVDDKDRFYREIARVLKPGAGFGLYDLLQGPGGEIAYPVPWARTEATSFMITPAALHDHLEQAGFEIVAFRDVSAAAKTWFQTVRALQGQSRRRLLGYHLLFGETFAQMGKNLVKNVAGDRVVAIEAICRKR